MTAVNSHMSDLGYLDWEGGKGFLPTVVQDAESGVVILFGYMNRTALSTTLESGNVTLSSQGNRALGLKRETSGNGLRLAKITVNQDRNALLVLAQGSASEGDFESCRLASPAFPQTVAEPAFTLEALEAVIVDRCVKRPPGSYTTKLLAEGMGRVAQKVGEEGVELALAAVSQDTADVVNEAADLLYHVLLLLQVRELSLAAVIAELERRHTARRR